MDPPNPDPNPNPEAPAPPLVPETPPKVPLTPPAVPQSSESSSNAPNEPVQGQTVAPVAAATVPADEPRDDESEEDEDYDTEEEGRKMYANMTLEDRKHMCDLVRQHMEPEAFTYIPYEKVDWEGGWKKGQNRKIKTWRVKQYKEWAIGLGSPCCPPILTHFCTVFRKIKMTQKGVYFGCILG